MAVALAHDEDLYHGKVGYVVVLVAALQSGPSEDVEGEVGIGLGPKGVLDIGGGEPRFEFLDPGLELLFQRGFSFWVGDLEQRSWSLGGLSLGLARRRGGEEAEAE